MTKKEIIKSIKKAFDKPIRPEQGVDDPKHCLACDETHATYQKIECLKQISPESFNVCYMSVECLNESALFYMMPRLLELVLKKKENEWDSFIPMVLAGLSPNKFGDRLTFYNKEHSKVIVTFLEFVKKRYSMEEYETWNSDLNFLFKHDYEKMCTEHIEQALLFWNEKLN